MDTKKAIAFETLEELYDWSLNFQPGRNPWCVVADLTGFSDEDYGTHMAPSEADTWWNFLGYREYEMIGEALKLLSRFGYDWFYDAMREVLASRESEGE